MRPTGSVLVTLALLANTGCAALFAQNPTPLEIRLDEPAEQVQVTIQSEQSGQGVVVRDRQAFQVEVDRRSDYRVTVSGPTIETVQARVGRRWDPLFQVDVGILGIGLLIIAFGVSLQTVNPGEMFTGGLINLVGFGFAFPGLAAVTTDLLTGNVMAPAPNPLRIDVRPRRQPGKTELQ